MEKFRISKRHSSEGAGSNIFFSSCGKEKGIKRTDKLKITILWNGGIELYSPLIMAVLVIN